MSTTTQGDVLGFHAARRRALLIGALLIVALLVTMGVGIMLGSVDVPAAATLRVLAAEIFGGEIQARDATHAAVIWEIRAPRVVLGLIAGAGLAVAGLVMQALVRNVLADPYIIGINSGASFGAAAAILFGIGAAFGEYALQASAFVGALVASLLIFFIARSQGRMTSIRLLMAGVALGYALTAGTNFLIFASDSAEGSRSVMFWTLGSLGLAQWSGGLAVVAVVVVLVTGILWALARKLDALAIGDETALTLGINPERFRMGCLLLLCMLIGAVVAMVGSIGFIGLIVPHLARRWVGGAHRFSIPISALLGALLLLVADLVARKLLAPEEIPIGIITALVGAPFLLILVRRMYAAQ